MMEPARPALFTGGGEDGKAVFARDRHRTLWQAVSDAGAGDPDRPALICGREDGSLSVLSYRELLDRARTISVGLVRLGVRPGDRVAVWMSCSPEWSALLLALMRIGAIVVPIAITSPEAHVADILGNTGARYLFIDDRFETCEPLVSIARICPGFLSAPDPGQIRDPELHDLRAVIVNSRTGARTHLAYDLHELEKAAAAFDTRWRDLADRMVRHVGKDDAALILYTAGTTDRPKAVELEQGGIVASGLSFGRRIGGGADARFYFAMSAEHALAGTLWGLISAVTNGACAMFCEVSDPGRAVDMIRDHHATVLLGAQVTAVLANAALRHLTLPGLHTTSFSPGEHAAQVPNRSHRIMMYGLMETYGPVAVSDADTPAHDLTECGRLLEGREIRVVEPQSGREMGFGETGEAWLRGNIMRGYWRDPVKTAQVIGRDGWFRTGDLVSVSTDGIVHFKGRMQTPA